MVSVMLVTAALMYQTLTRYSIVYRTGEQLTLHLTFSREFMKAHKLCLSESCCYHVHLRVSLVKLQSDIDDDLVGDSCDTNIDRYGFLQSMCHTL